MSGFGLPPRPGIGAVIYPPGHPPEALMAAFAAELAERGFRLGGLIQHTLRDETGRKTGMTVTELDTGRSLSIGQALGKESRSCMLDSQALAEASGAMRRARVDRVELMFANKFSKSEREGQGLAADLLAAAAEGIPALTAMPGVLIEDWIDFTGGRTDLISPTMEALWRWWGPEHLYADLARGVAPGPVRRVVIGLNWTMVEGEHGIGLAQTPERGAPGCRPTLAAGTYAARSLRELAGLAQSADPFDRAVGIAACNAHYNRFDLAAEPGNGLDSFGSTGDGIVVVGAFPGIAERLPGAKIIDRRPGPGQYPEQATHRLLPAAEAVVLTAATLANGSLPGLLRLARFAPVALVGPGAPLSPRLFRYGIAVTSGLVAEDGDGLARAVAEGGGARDLKRHGRAATLRATA